VQHAIEHAEPLLLYGRHEVRLVPRGTRGGDAIDAIRKVVLDHEADGARYVIGFE